MPSKQKKVERIKVYVRFKPLKTEHLKQIDYSLTNHEDGMQTLHLKNANALTRKGEQLNFKFDEIFPSTTSQSMVFEKVASPMVDKFVQKGVNCTIFSYGQTGSGKTYTICGLKQVNGRGIIHQTFGRLFDHVQASNPGEKYEIQVSFIEIYNDQIRDLSKSKSNSNVILFNTNITRIAIKNEASAIRLFENMKLKRKTSETNKNEHSSRSHLICTIYLSKYDHLLKIYDAEFNLVDLAGSERYDNIENKTTQFESRAVNESLYHLRQVTKKLADPNFKGNIPYRTSRLTWALENTLGGMCRVSLIANVDSLDKCLKESINTFEFATDIASIKKRSTNTYRHVPLRKTNYYGQNEYVETQLNELVQVRKKYDSLTNKFESLTNKCESLTAQHELQNEKEKEDRLRVRWILMSAISQLTELFVKRDESMDDIIILASQCISTVGHESALLEEMGKSPIMQEDVEDNVQDTESNSVAVRSSNKVRRWMRTVLDKFDTVQDFVSDGVKIGFGSAVGAAAGLGGALQVVASYAGLQGNVGKAAAGLGTVAGAAAVVGLGTVARAAVVVGFGGAAVIGLVGSAFDWTK